MAWCTINLISLHTPHLPGKIVTLTENVLNIFFNKRGKKNDKKSYYNSIHEYSGKAILQVFILCLSTRNSWILCLYLLWMLSGLNV